MLIAQDNVRTSINVSYVVTTTTTVVKTYFEQSVWSPKIHSSFAEPRCCFHFLHSPTLQRQLDETFIDYLHLHALILFDGLPKRPFPKHTFTSFACTMISQLSLLILKNTIFWCSHSSGKYSAVISTCKSQFARCDSLSDFCSPCRQMPFLFLCSFENMHFVILCLLCAAFATLPQLLHNNALCRSIAEEPTVTNPSRVADGMLIGKMLLPLLSTGGNSVTCRAGPCSTRHSFRQSV